jgi:mycothiol synthase
VSVEFRAPTLDDLPAISAFFAALRERYGAHVPSEGKVRDDLTRPSENVEENYRIVVDEGGVTGWATVWSPEAQTTRAFVGVRTLPRDRAADARLLDWAEKRAAERTDGGPVNVHVPVDDGDEPLVEELRARGYELVRHFFEMAIGLADEPPEASWPDGFAPRTFEPDDARAVYEADLEAFEDHWDPLDVTFEEWREYFLGSAHFDPKLWFLVDDGPELAGFSLCSRRDGEASGHVHVLGVRRPWRRRGLAKALLLHSFRELRSRGCEEARLNVDAENLTGAVRLYEDAGMHVAHRVGRWSKDLA